MGVVLALQAISASTGLEEAVRFLKDAWLEADSRKSRADTDPLHALLITGIAGLVMIVLAFIPTPANGARSRVSSSTSSRPSRSCWGGNLLKVHLKKISDQGAGWGWVVLVCFLVTLFVGLSLPEPQLPRRPLQRGDPGGAGSTYEYVFGPLTATMFSILAFYVASAACFEAILPCGPSYPAGQRVRRGLPHRRSPTPGPSATCDWRT